MVHKTVTANNTDHDADVLQWMMDYQESAQGKRLIGLASTRLEKNEALIVKILST